MVDKKISELDSVAAVAAANQVPINEAGTTKKFSITQLSTFFDTSTQTYSNKSISFTDNTITGTSAELATAISDETGTGLVVFNDSPSLITPDLGTPSALTLTNATGLPITGITSTTSAELATLLSDETGSGLTVFGTNPTFSQSIFLTEQAAAGADVAGDGQFWVKTATPNIPMFTDDAGTDRPLGIGTVSTYTITVDSGTYTATQTSDGSTVSSNTNLTTVWDAVITDIGAGGGASIEFGAGTFTINSPLTASVSNLMIKGQGPGVTIFSAGASLAEGDEAIDIGTLPGTTTYDIADAALEAQTITLDTGTDEDNFSAGDYILVRSDFEIDTTDSTRKRGEIHRVRSVTTDDTGVITLEETLCEDFDTVSAVSPSVKIIDTMINNISFSNFSFTDTRTLTTAGPQGYIRLYAAVGISFHNLEFNEIYRAAIGINGLCLNATFSDIKVNFSKVFSGNNLHYGINLVGPVQNMQVTNCNFHLVRHSVVMSSGSRTGSNESGELRNITQSNCGVYGNSGSGLDTHQGCKNVTFTGNTVESVSAEAGYTGGGITVRSQCNITGNIFRNMDSIGVNMIAGSSGSVVANNIIENLGDTGIYMTVNSINNIITGNYINNITGDGILGDSGSMRGCMIANNIIRNCSDDGIQGTALLDTVITGNYIDSVTDDGIVVGTSTTNCVIVCNYIHDSGDTGIRLVTSTVDSLVSGNVAKNATTAGFNLAATATTDMGANTSYA